MTILVDYNQVLLSAISAGHSTFGSDLNPDMIRHMFLNSVLGYKKKFGDKYGEIVICCDGANLWRKKVFAYYKAKRAASRAASPMDWDMIFDTMNKLRSELNEFFPYKVIHVEGAEGDDVIAVIVKYLQNNELVAHGLDERQQDILIISADSDFVQLQEYPNVYQWTPMFKKMIINHNAKEYRYLKIIKGDAGDGVPNVFSDDDTFVVEGKRQKPATEKKVAPILHAAMNDLPIPDDVAVNFDRNKQMIDLVDYAIPSAIEESILHQYKTAYIAPRSAMLAYFMQHRLQNLAGSINSF